MMRSSCPPGASAVIYGGVDGNVTGVNATGRGSIWQVRDGGMYVTSDQKEIKKFNTRDGLVLRIAKKNNIEVGFISNGMMEDLIGYRAQMLYVERYYVGNDKKLPVLEGWCKELGIELSQVAYIGDDINDLDVIRKVGLSACPSDAAPAVKAEVNIVLRTKGGKGCVREFGEMLGWTR